MSVVTSRLSRDKTQHSSRRKMQSTPYSQQAIMESSYLVGEKADLLVRRMKAAALSDPSGQVNAYHLCGLFSFEVICKVGFAKDFTDNADGESSKLLKAMDESAKMLPIVGRSLRPSLSLLKADAADCNISFLKNLGCRETSSWSGRVYFRLI